MSPTQLADIRALRDAMQKTCFEYREVTLSSGDKSNYYYDGKRLLFHPFWAASVARFLADLVLESGAEAVGGMAVGAVPIADNISSYAFHYLDAEVPVFVVRQEKKAHGTQEEIASAYRSDGTPLLRSGTTVAIVDDVVTKGGSVEKAIHKVEELGCKVVLVAAIVERHEGGGKVIASQGYPFKRLFYTDSSGNLSIDDAVLRRYSGANTAPVLR